MLCGKLQKFGDDREYYFKVRSIRLAIALLMSIEYKQIDITDHQHSSSNS